MLKEKWRKRQRWEEKTLLAEYALDFALLAADRALLLSMQAICAQRDFEREERKTS